MGYLLLPCTMSRHGVLAMLHIQVVMLNMCWYLPKRLYMFL